jgi:tetratricopeptide (TPR) repeat protein
VRLAFVTWGDARLETALPALRLRPQLALAHWLRATVYIARGAFDSALSELREGCAAQDAQPADDALYPGVGLHLLRGQVLVAQGRFDEAIHDLNAELVANERGQLYSQECAANTWYALGAIHLRQRQHRDAEAAFRQALTIAPSHLFSVAALGERLPARDPSDPRTMDVVIARAVALARGGRHREAAQIYIEGLDRAGTPNAGWTLPIEPILQPFERADIWAPVLEKVRQRAT